MISKGNVVIAGDEVFAGVDKDDSAVCKWAMVIEFENQQDFANAIKNRSVEFTLFELKEVEQ